TQVPDAKTKAPPLSETLPYYTTSESAICYPLPRTSDAFLQKTASSSTQLSVLLTWYADLSHAIEELDQLDRDQGAADPASIFALGYAKAWLRAPSEGPAHQVGGGSQ